MASPSPRTPLQRALDAASQPPSGRRWLAWLAFVGVLACTLGVPLLASQAPAEFANGLRRVPVVGPALADRLDASTAKLQSQRPDRPDAWALPRASAPYPDPTSAPPPPTAGRLDQVWNSGPLSSAHQPWAQDCKVCHAQPFERTRDEDCLSCHRGLGQHVDPGKVHFAPLAGQRCASCHREHEGELGLANQIAASTSHDCADCHRALSRQLPGTKVLDVADFADAHPDFRLQLATEPDGKTLVRTRLEKGAKPSEPTGLKFPHDVHLHEKGIDSPKGRVRMACSDCHVAQQDGLGFAPVTMAGHCQSCHALKIEPTLSNREVPHGDVATVLDSLREFYAWWTVHGRPPGEGGALTHTIEIRRPGQPPAPTATPTVAGKDPKTLAAQAAVDLFERTACTVCHEVKRLDAPGKLGTTGADLPQWSIAAVTPQHAWMPKSTFNHAAHSTAKCGQCHAATKSDKANDVLMPAITTCRECHAGAQPTVGKVTSSCTVCHGFHEPARLALPARATASRPVAAPEATP